MDVETADSWNNRSGTHKAFRPEPLSREQLDGSLELANWAPSPTDSFNGSPA